MHPQRTSGFTLIELMISISILSLVMLVVSMSLDSGVRLSDRVTRQTDINNRANGVLNQLAMQLRMSKPVDLSGGLPDDVTAQDSSKPGNLKAYKFAMATQLGGSPGWTEVYETKPRVIVHDYSVSPGRLLLVTYENNRPIVQLLTPEVHEDGFSLSRIGNTLQMSLSLRSETRAQEEILYTAQAQTLFLRSTLNESSGQSSMTFIPDPEDLSTTTDASPSIMFGNLVTELTVPPQRQISFFVTAPIGKHVDPAAIRVTVGNSDDTINQTIAEGATVTVDGATVRRATFPPATEWPSQNGTYSVTLTGNITGTITVKVTAATTDGVGSDLTDIATKRYSPTL